MRPLSLLPGKPVYNSTDATRTLVASRIRRKPRKGEFFALWEIVSRSFGPADSAPVVPRRVEGVGKRLPVGEACGRMPDATSGGHGPLGDRKSVAYRGGARGQPDREHGP